MIIIINSPHASRCIRPTHSQTNTLSRTAALVTFKVFHPTLFLSLSTVLLQVVFGLPLTLRLSGVHPNAIKQSFSPSHLSTCPNQFHFLLHTSQLISLISAISTTLLFVTLYCHVIFVIRLRHWHWKLFSFRSSAFVIFHVSQPYSRTGRIKVLNRQFNSSPSYSSRSPHSP